MASVCPACKEKVPEETVRDTHGEGRGTFVGSGEMVPIVALRIECPSCGKRLRRDDVSSPWELDEPQS